MFSLIAAMGSLQSDAVATNQQTAVGGGSTLIMLVVFIAIFYLFLIRPQKKRDKEQKDMLASMKKGDKVVTIGGIRGTVAAVKENTVIVKIDDNAHIEFNKSAISQILNAKAPEAAPAESKKKKNDSKLEIVEKPAEEKAPAKKTTAKKTTEKKAEEPAEIPADASAEVKPEENK